MKGNNVRAEINEIKIYKKSAKLRLPFLTLVSEFKGPEVEIGPEVIPR